MGQRRPLVAPFPLRWLSFELPGSRPSHSTYDLYLYDDLPPLPEDRLTGQLQWLVPLDREIDTQMQPYRVPAELQVEWYLRQMESMKEIVATAQQVGLCIPPVFLQFIASTELQNRIPSCTDCWFMLSSMVSYPSSQEGYIIRFLQDNQGCFAWYLYLLPNGQECVLVSSIQLDLMVTNPEQFENISHKEMMEHTYVCAPSFEAFLYRFWIENVLWFNLQMRKPLAEEQQYYLSYYRPER